MMLSFFLKKQPFSRCWAINTLFHFTMKVKKHFLPNNDWIFFKKWKFHPKKKVSQNQIIFYVFCLVSSCSKLIFCEFKQHSKTNTFDLEVPNESIALHKNKIKTVTFKNVLQQRNTDFNLRDAESHMDFPFKIYQKARLGEKQ